MALSFPMNAQESGVADTPVEIGNLSGNEVIVHVYRTSDDPFPFIEFSVTVDESTGRQIVDVTEVEGRTTDGGFMIISGVKRAGEVGVQPSERYEVSFQKVGDYKIYEKAVMDYLRRLPVPEIELAPEVEDLQVIATGTSEEEAIELELIAEDLENDTDEDLSDEVPVPRSGIAVDSNSVIVHVHRNAEDVDPFKEFVLTTQMVDGEEKVHAIEATGLQPQGKFIIITGFDEDSLGGVKKSSGYELIPYNIYEYEQHEQAVLDIMLKLSPTQFSGEESTIGLNWEEEIAVEEVRETVPVRQSSMFPDPKAKKKKTREVSQREIDKIAKQVERAKYKAPKNHNIYRVKKSKKMSSRLSGLKKKTHCPSFRY